MYPNILSEQQRSLLPFVQSLRREFYLVGGTAIALQIGHRQSIDFDLFKRSNINRTRLARTMDERNIHFRLLFADAEGFHVLANEVKVTFFQFPFDIPAAISFEGIRMPDLLHLASMKAYALGRRAKWKDYVDLYFLLNDHFPIATVMEKASLLFPGLFSPKLFKQQLCFFDDVDYMEEVAFMPGREVSMETIKAFLAEIATRQL
jgi:hypothetical protein